MTKTGLDAADMALLTRDVLKNVRACGLEGVALRELLAAFPAGADTVRVCLDRLVDADLVFERNDVVRDYAHLNEWWDLKKKGKL